MTNGAVPTRDALDDKVNRLFNNPIKMIEIIGHLERAIQLHRN